MNNEYVGQTKRDFYNALPHWNVYALQLRRPLGMNCETLTHWHQKSYYTASCYTHTRTIMVGILGEQEKLAQLSSGLNVGC